MAQTNKPPTKDHVFLIPGCGTDGTGDGFGCKPESGHHTFPHYKQVYPFLHSIPSAGLKLISPAPETEWKDDEGQLPTSSAYTVNPSSGCHPHFHGAFLDTKGTIGNHKFAMVHQDHAVSPGTQPSIQWLKETLHLSLEYLDIGGVLYWEIFGIKMLKEKGVWVYKSGEPVVPNREVYVALERMLEDAVGKGHWKRVWDTIYDSKGLPVADPENAPDGETGSVSAFLVRKVK